MSSKEDFYVVFGDKVDTFKRTSSSLDLQFSRQASEKMRYDAGHTTPAQKPYVPIGSKARGVPKSKDFEIKTKTGKKKKKKSKQELQEPSGSLSRKQ